MGTLWQDVRYGSRMLAKAPGFTAVVVLTLALGIGANTALFDALDKLTMRSLPVENARELVRVNYVTRSEDLGGVFNYPLYEAYRDQSEVFSSLAAFNAGIDMCLRVDAVVKQIAGVAVSSNYFACLGVKPALGRVFDPDQDRDAAMDPIAVISDRLWRREFQSDANVIGQQIVVDDRSLTIVGVAPPGFNGTEVGALADVYIPLGIAVGSRLHDDGSTWLSLLGRLKPGISRDQAQVSLRVLASRIKTTGLDNTRSMS